MAVQITNYQCPACTAPLNFSPETGRLECEYCGSSFDAAQIEAMYAPKEQQAAQAMAEAEVRAETQAAQAAEGGWDVSGMSGWGEEGANMRAYSCPSCGAQLICDASTAATSCPYCSNPTVVPGQFAGALKPDFIIPFAVNKEQAVAALKQHYKGKPFLPSSFTAENHLQEIRGVYVPFWLFSGSAEGSASYEATRSRTYRQGDYRVTETSHFMVGRGGSIAFEKVPVDASTKMPDAHMDSIEPFDYSALRPFSTAYLPGFLADRYDVTVENSAERADTRCAETMAAALHASALDVFPPYETCIELGRDIQLQRGRVQYALLPVWLLNTKWQGKDFLFAMNGQTGKLAGDLPVSRAKFWGAFAAICAGLSAVVIPIISAML